MLATPTEDEIENIPSSKNREFIRSLPKKKGKDFDKLFSGASAEAIDLLRKMLTFDPNKRITVEQALGHAYLKDLHYPEDEPSADPVSAFDFDFEMYDLNGDELKDLIYEEILLYHSEDAQKQYIENKKKYPNGMLGLNYADKLKKKKSKKK